MDELASLQESAREIALERFRIIQPYLEQDRSLSVIARKARIPYRTIHRWLTRYWRFGLAALARKAREDRGKRRALSLQLLDDGDGVLRSWVFACISFSSEEHVKDYDNEKQIN